MNNVFGELLPVFLLIVIGYGVRATRILSREAFGHVNRFGFFVLYPAFLFKLSAEADLSGGEAGVFMLAATLGFITLFVLALATKPLFKREEGPTFTSMFQGSVRWNGFLLLAAAPALYGPAGPHLIGLAFGPLVLFVNLVCLLVLARWGSNGANSARAVFDQIVANPLVIGCAAGLIAQAFGMRQFGPLDGVLDMLGSAALPIALMCVGAGLDFKAVRAARVKVAAAAFAKLLVAPAIMWGVATLIGASPMTAAIAAGVGCTPTAAVSYTMAREMGGDAQLMAAIVTATTLLSFITMPLVIGLTLHH